MVHIRLMSPDDRDAVVSILNQSIRNHRNGYVTEMTEDSALRWHNNLLENALIAVCATIESRVVAWGSLTTYRSGRGAFSQVAEITFYVDQDFHRRGIGRSLIHYMEDVAKSKNIKSLVAILLGDNHPSISLLNACRYNEWGRLPDIARFTMDTKDHLYFGKNLS